MSGDTPGNTSEDVVTTGTTTTSTTTTGTGSGTPAPASSTPPAPGQGQGWLMNLLAEKFGFGSGQDLISSIVDMIFGQLDLSGIPIIGDLLSRGRNNSRTAANDGPTTDTVSEPTNQTQLQTQTTTVGTANEQQPPRRGLDGIDGQRQFTQVAGTGTENTTDTNPSLTPGTPSGPGVG